MPLRGMRQVKTHAAARLPRRVGSQVARRCAACGKWRYAAARRVESEDTPLRGVWKVKIRRCAACGK